MTAASKTPKVRRDPKYRRHSSGQARVTINKHDHYLGKWDTPESRETYARVLAEHRAGTLTGETARGVTMRTLGELFRAEHALRVVAETARQQKQAHISVDALYGSLPVAQFGTLQLLTVRAELIAAGHTRKHVNQRIRRIISAVSWGVKKNLVIPSVWHALACVGPLLAGESAARESREVVPADETSVRAVLPFLQPNLAALVELHMLCGARSGELLQLTAAMLRTGTDPWAFPVAEHKNARRGKSRTIHFGPRAQAILLKVMAQWPADTPLFGPVRCFCGMWHGRERKSRWTAAGYRNAVDEGIARALRAGLAIKRFHPHQLRHLFATRVRADFGLDAAQIVLGHERQGTTQIYARPPAAAAIAAVQGLG